MGDEDKDDEGMGISVGASAWQGKLADAKSPAQPESAQSDDEIAALTREARLGSLAAFASLFERFQAPIVNYIYRIVSDWDSANDLAQDTFLKAYSALPRAEETLQFAPWLYRIATNTALDSLRRRKRITWLPLKADLDVPETSLDPAPRQAEGDVIQQALAQVPADQRTCLVLNMYQGLSYKEIAEVLGITANLVAVRIYRGREKFIDAYKKANG